MTGEALIPGEVRALLGDEPEHITRFGSAVVLRGRGMVAKVGPTAGRNTLALGLDLPLTRPGLAGTELDEPLGEWWQRVRGYGNLDVELASDLRAVLDDPTLVFGMLASSPRCLVHADPYRRNVRRPHPGARVWIDWDDAVLGPPAIDLAAWLLDSHWYLGRRIDPDTVLTAYRSHSRPTTPEVSAIELDAALILVTVSQDLVALRVERGQSALDRFVAERMEALERLESSR